MKFFKALAAEFTTEIVSEGYQSTELSRKHNHRANVWGTIFGIGLAVTAPMIVVEAHTSHSNSEALEIVRIFEGIGGAALLGGAGGVLGETSARQSAQTPIEVATEQIAA